MADTKTLTILKRLTTLLAGITPANGYDLDLTGRVFRGKRVFGDNEPVPFVSILESMRPDAQPDEAGFEKMVRVECLDLLIQGWAKTEQDTPTDNLYGLKGALEKRLARMVVMNGVGNPVYPSDYRLGRLLTSARIGPGVIRAATPQPGGTECLYLPLMVWYKADVSDPWALD